MKNFSVNQSIGDIVTINPKASNVFKKYHIDFCCGGQRLLKEAIKEQQIEEEKLMKELEDAYNDFKAIKEKVDFSKLSNGELIDYIVNNHHIFLVNILPELNEYILKILKVHGVSHKILFKVHKLFSNLKGELEQHLIKEEEFLFPLIKEYDNNPSEELFDKIQNITEELEDEHDGAGDIIKELRIITNQYEVPADGCASYRITFDKLQELESDLFEHIHLENNILFKNIGLI